MFGGIGVLGCQRWQARGSLMGEGTVGGGRGTVGGAGLRDKCDGQD